MFVYSNVTDTIERGIKIENITVQVLSRKEKILLLSLLEPTSFVGIVINCVFLFFNLLMSTNRKDYFLFFYVMSLLNIIFCLSVFVGQPFLTVMDITSESSFCKILGCIIVISGNGAVSVQSLLTVNRYVTLYYPTVQKNLFSRKNTILLLVIISILPNIFMCIFLLYFNYIGRMNDTICAPKMELMSFGHLVIYFSPMLLDYSICILCTFKVYRLIRTHQVKSTNFKSKLRESKDIVRLVIIEITVPVCLSTPVIISCFLLSTVAVPKEFFFCALSLFILHTVTDPVIIMVVVKPYRKAIKEIWSRMKPTATTNNGVIYLTTRY